jgi:hypothetical protein
MTSAGSPERSTLRHVFDACGVRRLRLVDDRGGSTGVAGFLPRGVARQDQGRDLARLFAGLGDRGATSQATACDEPTVRTQWLSGRARPSMSEVSGGSYFRCAPNARRRC